MKELELDRAEVEVVLVVIGHDLVESRKGGMHRQSEIADTASRTFADEEVHHSVVDGTAAPVVAVAYYVDQIVVDIVHLEVPER